MRNKRFLWGKKSVSDQGLSQISQCTLISLSVSYSMRSLIHLYTELVARANCRLTWHSIHQFKNIIRWQSMGHSTEQNCGVTALYVGQTLCQHIFIFLGHRVHERGKRNHINHNIYSWPLTGPIQSWSLAILQWLLIQTNQLLALQDFCNKKIGLNYKLNTWLVFRWKATRFSFRSTTAVRLSYYCCNLKHYLIWFMALAWIYFWHRLTWVTITSICLLAVSVCSVSANPWDTQGSNMLA